MRCCYDLQHKAKENIIDASIAWVGKLLACMQSSNAFMTNPAHTAGQLQKMRLPHNLAIPL